MGKSIISFTAFAFALFPYVASAAPDGEGALVALKKARTLGDLSSLSSVSLRGTYSLTKVPLPPSKTPPSAERMISLLDRAVANDQRTEKEQIALAWDDKSFYSKVIWLHQSTRLRSWDGSKGFSANLRPQPGASTWEISPDINGVVKTFTPRGCRWFELAGPPLWWSKPSRMFQLSKRNPDLFGENAAYDHAGSQVFGGERCLKLVCPGREEVLFISNQTGLIRGWGRLLLTSDQKSGAYLAKYRAAASKIAGQPIATTKEFFEWSKGRPPEEQRLAHEEFQRFRIGQGYTFNMLVRFSDFKEVAPGIWFPWSEERVFAQAHDVTHEYKITTGRFHLKQLDLDQPLPVAQFKAAPRDGDSLLDGRNRPIMVTAFRSGTCEAGLGIDPQANRSRAELLAGLDALIGKAAPPLPEAGWLQGKRPNQARMLLHFGDARSLSATDTGYAKRLSERMPVVSIFPSDIPVAVVRQFIQREEINHPVLHAKDPRGTSIAGWPVEALRWFVLVDENGGVAAHGSAREIYDRISD